MEYKPLFVDGIFVDNMELFERNKPGNTHLCECRGNHDAFFSRTAFTQHIKLKCHQKWLTTLRKPVISPLSHPLLSLRDEQDDEYERTLQEDRQKAENKMKKIIKESEEQYKIEQEKRFVKEELERKRKSIVSEPGYTFRFIFPDGKKVNYTIHKTRPVSYMRDIVDVYMADHQNIYNYELFMFPNKILESIHTIEEAGIENKSSIYIRSLDN
jgi:hypothetical protein